MNKTTAYPFVCIINVEILTSISEQNCWWYDLHVLLCDLHVLLCDLHVTFMLYCFSSNPGLPPEKGNRK